MKYVPPHLRNAQTEIKEEVIKTTEQLKLKEEELKKQEKEIETDSSTEGDDFEIIINSVVISQISKNKDLRGELLGYYVKTDNEKKKNKKNKQTKTNDGDIKEKKETETEQADEDQEEEQGEQEEEEKNKKNDQKKIDIEINQSFCVCNIEDIFIDKINKLVDKYQLSKQKYNDLLNNIVLYFSKNKYEEGEKYINEVNTYYDNYLNIMAELNFETTSFGFYINANDIKKKEVLATLILCSLINKNSFALCYEEKYGKLTFSAYKIDVDVIFYIKNQIKNSSFNQFNDILNIELKKSGLNSKNILQKIPIRIKNSILNSLFLKILKNKNKNYISSNDYLNSLEVNLLENHVQETCKSLGLLKSEQEKIVKYKKDVFKQLQSQKVYQEKKKLEKEKNKIVHNLDTNEEDINIQNMFKNIPQPSLLFPCVLTMSNNMLNDSINNLCSHSIAKSYLYYKNTNP